jgi:DNA-directed RNA polymerase I subunit RPA12
MDVDHFHTDFCPVCGAIIELETIGDAIVCQICKSQRSFEEFAGRVMRTELHIRKDKEWLQKYEGKQMRERRGKTKMIIREQCPKCGHPELKYYTVQTRSVDEGSTVFYEC